MEEKYEGGDIVIRSPFMKKLENFWYHYKWHSLIALFVVFALVICSVQLCTREEYDLHIVYAGPDDIRMTASEGLSEYRVLYSSLKLCVEDFDENGEIVPNFQTLFLPSEAEIEAINQQNREEKNGLEVQMNVVIENAEQLDAMMLISDYYLCFLSEANYLTYRDRAEGFFVPLAPYVGTAAVTYYEGADNAVYLSSTALASLPGFEDLDGSTLICLRSVSEVAKRADRRGWEKKFSAAQKVLKNIFSSAIAAQE
ncbi:MAG: hypothetical protein J6J66_05345 [Clostridia bacterium]|nr:hypothetical protein [Clostridia bacterium]